ncbi:hypothetical protein [Kribbella sp. NPDC051718]|uniref:hypothetical protein n=1 Tax=Kribbella sp. NPDC051718 TaxID=3155168 RepID=UPI00342A62F2
MTKILVTGATGNVGRELTRQLPPGGFRSLSRQSWTILRANTIASNARGWATQIRSTGVVRGPGIPATAVVHERDIAAVATRALTSADLAGQRLVLTGPTVVSRAEQVAALGTVLGRELRFEPVAAGDARTRMLADGRPAALVEALLANVGRPPSTLITATIEEVTGQPARSFGDWAAEHGDEFRQSPEPRCGPSVAGCTKGG